MNPKFKQDSFNVIGRLLKTFGLLVRMLRKLINLVSERSLRGRGFLFLLIGSLLIIFPTFCAKIMGLLGDGKTPESFLFFLIYIILKIFFAEIFGAIFFTFGACFLSIHMIRVRGNNP